MKLKSLLLVGCLSLMSSLYAQNHHLHPKASMETSGSVKKSTMMPGYCQIEIINSSFENVTVYGTFDDSTPLAPFNILSADIPNYVDLYYYNYCHRDMYLDIVTFSGYHVYTGFTLAGSTINIVPFLANQIKAEVHKR